MLSLLHCLHETLFQTQKSLLNTFNYLLSAELEVDGLVLRPKDWLSVTVSVNLKMKLGLDKLLVNVSEIVSSVDIVEVELKAV